MVEKTKVLFVDDEPRILTGFRRSFHHKKDQWEIFFASSGEEALQLLEKEKCKVIVTDMRMPQIDGATLLQTVQNLYPDMIRVILSGQTELEMLMRNISVAHQFLIKPCSPEYLEEIIDRSCTLQDNLHSEELKKLIGKLDKLPSLPKTYQALYIALSDPNVTFEEIASIFEKDIAISAKLIQFANSAYFCLPYKTNNIIQAISLIGMDMIRNLTFLIGAFGSFGRKDKVAIQWLEQLRSHSILSANIAKNLFEDKHQSNDAYLAGMLHKIGSLLIITHFPKEYEIILKESQNSGKEMHVVEKDILGVSHAQVGAYLLDIWGIPYSVVEAVANYIEPFKVNHNELNILSATYIADQLALDIHTDKIDLQYLERLDVLKQLPQWREMAQSVISRAEG